MSDQKTKIEFANETEIPEDAYLWRYLDLHKFLSFVIGKSLFFISSASVESESVFTSADPTAVLNAASTPVPVAD